MKRLIVVLGLLLLVPSASAGAVVHVQGGYVSTAPLVLEDMVVVRASGTFDGLHPPSLTAFGQGAEVLWALEAPSTVQPDMAELVHVRAGSGACGSWQELLLVAWSSGRLDAVRPDDGHLLWTVQTEVSGWGLTATPTVVDDETLLTTREGLERRCLANGELLARMDTASGWRNAPTLHQGVAYVGDEHGRLWAWNLTTNSSTSIEVGGRLRHAPVVVEDGLLLHLQRASDSLLTWHPLNGTQPEPASSNHALTLGPAPGMPVLLPGGGVAVADGSGVHRVAWSDDGWDLTLLDPRPVNGPLRVEGHHLLGSVNLPEGGHLIYDLEAARSLAIEGPLGYGTAPPVPCGAAYLLVKDDGLMHLAGGEDGCPLQAEAPVVDRTDAVWTLSLLVAFVLGAVVWKRRGPLQALRWTSPLFLLALILVLPQVGTWWAGLGPTVSSETPWDPSWPEAWKGSQVVVFETPEESLAIGGLPASSDVFEATLAAAVALDLELEIEEHSLGPWILAIDGYAGQGWVVEVDGVLLSIGAAEAPLDEAAVVVWRPV